MVQMAEKNGADSYPLRFLGSCFFGFLGNPMSRVSASMHQFTSIVWMSFLFSSMVTFGSTISRIPFSTFAVICSR